MADQTGESAAPTGLGINVIDDVAQETQPGSTLPERMEESDGLATVKDTDAPGQHNEPLEVVTDHASAPGNNNEPPPKSDFSFSSEDDEDADDEGQEEDDNEVDDEMDWESEAPNNAPCQPHEEPIRAVLGVKGEHEDVFRENPYHRELPPDKRRPFRYHYRSDSDSDEHKKYREKVREEFEMQVEPNVVVRPSPLRTASSADSPLSPKKTKPVGDAEILPEPTPELRDRDVASSLEDRELTARPPTQNPTVLPTLAGGFDWSEEDEEDTTWFEQAVGTPSASRRGSGTSLEQASTADQTPADAGDKGLTNQESLSLVSPIDQVGGTGNEMVVCESGADDETIYKSEASEHEMQMSHRDVTASVSFQPSFAGAEDPDSPAEVQSPMTDQDTRPFAPVFEAEQHANRGRAISPTSPNFNGPEPLTGLTPEEGLEAWWAWRDRTKTDERTFRNNRNFANQRDTGDLNPTNRRQDAPEALEYLNAQRLTLHQQLNVEKEHLQEMARRSYGFSEAIKFDLKSTQEYIKLRMLKYRAERNRFFDRAVDEYQRVERRNEQIKGLNANLREAEQAYFQLLAEKESIEPALQKEREKRERLKAKYQEKSEDLDAYKRAAERSGEDLRSARAKEAKRAAPLQFSSIIEVAQKPMSDSGEKPVSGTNEKPTQARESKHAAPLQFSNITEIYSQEPVGSPPSPFSPSFPKSRGPAPEHAANWPLADRPPLVDFMTRWINEHRESYQANPQPLRKPQLDQILGVGFLSWDQLIEDLRLLGHTIRPDHLAQALADPDNIIDHRLPQPNTAVMYAARRLDKRNAVKALIDEISELEREAKHFRIPVDVMEELKHARAAEGFLQDLVRKMEDQRGELVERNRKLKKALSRFSGDEELEVRVALQARLDETQQALDQVLSEAFSPKSPKSPDPRAGDYELLLEEKLAICKENNWLLREQRDDLKEKLDACHAYGKLLESNIADLEARIAALDSNQAGDAMGDWSQSEELENKKLELELDLAACTSHGKQLQARADELEQQLAASRSHSGQLQARIEELEHELEVQGMQQQGDAGSSSDLSDRLQAAEQHARDLQAKVDELQLQVDGAETSTKKGTSRMSEFENQRLAEIKETKAHRDSHEVQLIKQYEIENALVHETLEALRKENLALKERAKSHEEPLPTSEPAQSNLGPVVDKGEGEEDVATLRRELAEARKKNEQLEQDKFLLQSSLDVAQENVNILREKVHTEPREGPAPANGLGLDSPLQRVKDVPSQGERAQDACANGSVADLEEFVFDQSDSEAEGNSRNASDNDKDGSPLGSDASSSDAMIITEKKRPAPPSMSEQSPIDSPTQDNFSITGEMLGLYSPIKSNTEHDDDKKRADDLAEANVWLQADNEKAWKEVEALEEKLKKSKRSVETPLPGASKSVPPPPPQSHQPSTTPETATQMNRVPRPLPAATRERVPLPAEPSVATKTLSAAHIARRAAMQQSPTFIAGMKRRRVVRERELAVERERISSICRRAAAIFGEEEFPYVPVEQRYKPMVMS